MNWVLVAVAVIVILNGLLGLKKGFVKIVLSMISVIVTLVLVMVLTPYVSDAMKETEVYQKINESTYEYVHEHLAEETFETGTESIQSLPLPESVKEMLMENGENYASAGIEVLTNYIADSLSDMIFNAMVFVITFVIVLFVVNIVFSAINLISKLPVLNSVNKLAGFAVGVAEGLVIVWIFFVFITVFNNSEMAISAYQQIESSKLLTFLYENNILMKLILSFSA